MVGILLFVQRLRQQSDDGTVTKLLGDIAGRCVAGDLIMLNALRSPD